MIDTTLDKVLLWSLNTLHKIDFDLVCNDAVLKCIEISINTSICENNVFLMCNILYIYTYIFKKNVTLNTVLHNTLKCHILLKINILMYRIIFIKCFILFGNFPLFYYIK